MAANTNIWQGRAPELILPSCFKVSNTHGNAYRPDLWSKIERTLMQSFLQLQVNMGPKSDFLLSLSFFSAGLVPQYLKLRQKFLHETAALWLGQYTDSFFSLRTPPLPVFFQGPLLARLLYRRNFSTLHKLHPSEWCNAQPGFVLHQRKC